MAEGAAVSVGPRGTNLVVKLHCLSLKDPNPGSSGLGAEVEQTELSNEGHPAGPPGSFTVHLGVSWNRVLTLFYNA